MCRRNYACKPINIGSNTDPYQPIEKRWRLTRAALALLNDCNHPCTLVTKNSLVERDLNILVLMANAPPRIAANSSKSSLTPTASLIKASTRSTRIARILHAD
jgi:DNA repair photolyase